MKNGDCTMTDAFIGIMIGFVVWAVVVWLCGVVM